MTLATMLAVTILGSVALTETVNFDSLATGAPPPGWAATKTGTGAPKWTIEKDDTAPSKANVLKQSGQATYRVCIKDDTNLKDGFVLVKFKPVRLRVNFDSSHFTIMFDGKQALEWDDSAFKDAGKVGIRTEADSVTPFDDFTYAGK
jgi:hypothetical protein